jgi:hypothetical protein
MRERICVTRPDRALTSVQRVEIASLRFCSGGADLGGVACSPERLGRRFNQIADHLRRSARRLTFALFSARAMREPIWKHTH